MTKPAILVTGGAKRIGAALARAFANAGWHVVIHYGSSAKEARNLAGALPSAEVVQCDLADDGAAVSMIEDLCARLPTFRCLINCAAIFRYDDATNLDPRTNRDSMQVNALSPARMMQAFLAHAKGPAPLCAIQFSDMKIANPNPDFYSYTMSKHAAASTIAMQAIHAGDAARIYGIAPGAILPSHDQSEAETEVSHRMNLLGRKTGVDEIAGAALFLATGTLKSGSTLYVDSGQHMLSQDRDIIYLARREAV
ncbi:SDR family oxidoreductase [Erythrobacter sp.]|jgi:NAD(P)-dependent dehydrogenase (short-subunit alcohol dehydrogenase family)|uniref:SDR family oxidoreductase n=1 Tax=Erythrobacter sp. TaxID=1042 RepID=UPI002EC2832B|nr:SDR family oxidoreductase [Erythrobacter sp.]